MHPLVRIAYVGFKRIDAGWSFTHRSSPFWRLYHDFDPGAAVEGPDGRFALDPAQVLLLPAGTVFSAVPPAQPVRHLFVQGRARNGDDFCGHIDILYAKCEVCQKSTAHVARASRQAVPGGGSHCGGWRLAPTPLRCSIRGRAEELAVFAALTPLKQLRQA